MITLSIASKENETNESLGLTYLVRQPKTTTVKRRGIILLHGVGSNEKDLFALSAQLPDDMVIIAARGPFTLGADRYAWYEVNFTSGVPVFNAAQEESSRSALIQFIRKAKEQYHIDELYLGGFSQGAIMSYSVGLTNPGLVKGVVILSGRLLEEVRALITANATVQNVTVFMAHGIQDHTLPVNYARNASAFLMKLRVPLDYHEYVMGHQVSEAVINDLTTWLNAKK